MDRRAPPCGCSLGDAARDPRGAIAAPDARFDLALAAARARGARSWWSARPRPCGVIPPMGRIDARLRCDRRVGRRGGTAPIPSRSRRWSARRRTWRRSTRRVRWWCGHARAASRAGRRRGSAARVRASARSRRARRGARGARAAAPQMARRSGDPVAGAIGSCARTPGVRSRPSATVPRPWRGWRRRRCSRIARTRSAARCWQARAAAGPEGLDPATPDAYVGTLALVIAARQLGEDPLADALAPAILRRLYLAPRLGSEAVFWALAASTYGALGAGAPESVDVEIDGHVQSVSLEGGARSIEVLVPAPRCGSARPRRSGRGSSPAPSVRSTRDRTAPWPCASRARWGVPASTRRSRS